MNKFGTFGGAFTSTLLTILGAITNLFVSDRESRIVYAANAQELGHLITSVYLDLPVSNEAINWVREDGRLTTSIPIFSVGVG